MIKTEQAISDRESVSMLFNFLKFDFKRTLDLLPGMWCVVDSNSNYLYYNMEYAALIGVENLPLNYYIGKNSGEVSERSAKATEIFKKINALVISSKATIIVVNCKELHDGKRVILQIRNKPIIDANGKVEAILCNITDLSSQYMFELALNVAKEYQEVSMNNAALITINKIKRNVHMKPCEEEVLFYLSRRCSYKEIAAIQKVSYRTIVDRVERLRVKFDASSTSELIRHALSSGYPLTLPKDIFNQELFIVIPD